MASDGPPYGSFKVKNGDRQRSTLPSVSRRMNLFVNFNNINLFRNVQCQGQTKASKFELQDQAIVKHTTTYIKLHQSGEKIALTLPRSKRGTPGFGRRLVTFHGNITFAKGLYLQQDVSYCSSLFKNCKPLLKVCEDKPLNCFKATFCIK